MPFSRGSSKGAAGIVHAEILLHQDTHNRLKHRYSRYIDGRFRRRPKLRLEGGPLFLYRVEATPTSDCVLR